MEPMNESSMLRFAPSRGMGVFFDSDVQRILSAFHVPVFRSGSSLKTMVSQKGYAELVPLVDSHFCVKMMILRVLADAALAGCGGW